VVRANAKSAEKKTNSLEKNLSRISISGIGRVILWVRAQCIYLSEYHCIYRCC
jgi:hypothetical protein